MTDSAKIKKAISEILDDADLNTITAKKVRQQLEAKLKTDLTDRKKEIDGMVMEILEKRQEQDKSEEEEESEDEGKKAAGKRRKRASSGSEDEAVPEKKPKGKAKKADDSDNASDEDWGKNKRKKAAAPAKGKDAAPKKRGGTGFTKILKLSPELSSVMGQEEMARHEVVKKIWSIIKEKNLYDPKNKQFAICNEELLPVMGVKRFRTFGMMKHLKNHFIN